MATAVAALMARARRQVQHHFFAADAVRPDRAVSFEPANGFERRWFERMRGQGVVKQANAGQYWLDLPAYDRLIQARLKRARLALLTVLILFGLYVLLAGPAAFR